MTDHYPDNYSDEQHGRDLCTVIRKGDMLELWHGDKYRAASEMQGDIVSARIGGLFVPIHDNAIVAVWRNGVRVYRMGETLPVQLELFGDVA